MALRTPPAVITVDSFTECHVTPPTVAARMVGYLGPKRACLTLEPQAGTGNLIQALFDAGQVASELVAIERHTGLCAEIRRRFGGRYRVEPINQCFLEYAEAARGNIAFPRIIMNPPFKTAKKHVNAALSLLGRGGRSGATLVALVPTTYTHCGAETLEDLPRSTFQTTQVATKIVRFEKRR